MTTVTRLRRTHCRQGHRLTPDNLTRHQTGPRCRTCDRERNRRRHHRNWSKRHAGHDFVRGQLGQRICLTCRAGTRPGAVDEIAVERAMNGRPPARLTPAERAEAVLRLRARGLSGKEVAALVGCADRTVWRILKRHRQGWAVAA